MKPSVLVDTGPLIAFFRKSDRYHVWAKKQFQALHPPIYTCEAVLTETCFLLSNSPASITLLFHYIERGILQIKFRLAEELKPVCHLIQRYQSIPMSLADACLVRMSEILENPVVLTIDNDFHIYRRHGRAIIPILSPEL